MGKRKINSSKMKYDGIIFDSTLELSFYMHLQENKELLKIKSIDIHPTFKLYESYVVECLKCEGIGKVKSLKTSREIQCRSCKGSGHSQRQGMSYTPDFVIEAENGKLSVFDVKGYKNDTFPLYKKIFENKYHHRVIEVYRNKKTLEWVYK